MNFLTHYYVNRHVRGLDGGPYFAMGVALPDIWPRFSRTRRIGWRSVEAARPEHVDARSLRAGLLNHAADDRRFHTLPLFLEWQRHVRRAVAPSGGDAVSDFLSHIAVELALDCRLLDADAGLAGRYYAELSACVIARVEAHGGALAGVDATGLGAIVAGFIERRFLARYVEPGGMPEAIRRVFQLTRVPDPPPTDAIRTAVDAAMRAVQPNALWVHFVGS